MPGLLEALKQAIVDGDDDAALSETDSALEAGLAPLDILNQAIVTGIEEAGRLWNDGDYFLPDIILSASAFNAALRAIEPHLAGTTRRGTGRILFGVVEGDMHDLGKNIVIALLNGAGFEVIDLGVNVPAQTFVDKVEEMKPDILALGAYMTTTMLKMKNIIRSLRDGEVGSKVKVMIGGVPTSQTFADEISADAWGENAIDAVAKAKRLMESG